MDSLAMWLSCEVVPCDTYVANRTTALGAGKTDAVKIIDGLQPSRAARHERTPEAAVWTILAKRTHAIERRHCGNVGVITYKYKQGQARVHI